MNLLKSCILVLAISLASCAQKKDVQEVDKTAQEVVKDVSEEMIGKGFKKGTVMKSSDSGCPFTIKIDDPNINYLLDPINLEEEYKKEGQLIWFQYSPLRMQNRCNGANPVTIVEIQKR